MGVVATPVAVLFSLLAPELHLFLSRSHRFSRFFFPSRPDTPRGQRGNPPRMRSRLAVLVTILPSPNLSSPLPTSSRTFVDHQPDTATNLVCTYDEEHTCIVSRRVHTCIGINTGDGFDLIFDFE